MPKFVFLLLILAGCGPLLNPSADDGGGGTGATPAGSDGPSGTGVSPTADTTSGSSSGGSSSGGSSSSGSSSSGSTSNSGESSSSTTGHPCTDPIEVGEGGVGQSDTGLWYSGCFTETFACETCSAWCAYAGFGSCLFLHTTNTAACEPYGDGINQVGACEVDVFTEWPPESLENLHVRCVCAAA